MRRYVPSQTSFLKDVKNHVMSIELDQGLHRHLRCRNPASFAYHFDVVTWPGHLSISGDMHDFTFSRIADMFEFFRPDPGMKAKLPINLGYWAEKVQAESRHGGVEEWSSANFKRIINRYMFSHGWPKPVREEVNHSVIAMEGWGEHEFKEAAYSFRIDHDGKRYEFVDLWDYGDAKVYTNHYIWCCYAIVWAIKQYDRAKSEQGKGVA